MPNTIGQQLKLAREARNLSIEKVVEATRIRAVFIEAMESDDFEALPSPVQTRGFLRLYAEYLGLSLDGLIANQRPLIPDAPAPPVTPTIPGTDAQAAEPIREAPPVVSTTETFRDRFLGSLQTGLGGIRTSLKGWLQKIRPAIQPGRSPAVATAREGGSSLPEGPAEPAAPPEDLAEASFPAEVTRPSPKSDQAQAIYTAIGKQLRDRREGLSLTLEEIERHTRVRTHYLQALEAGDFQRLPSSVQARGMLNNYAHFLDMDVDAILLQFADGLQAELSERQSQPAEVPQPPESSTRFNFPIKIHLPSALRRYLSPDLLVGGGLILFLIVFAIWGTARVVNLRSVRSSQPTPPLIVDILVATPEVTMTPSPTTGIAAAEIPPVEGATQAIAIPTGGRGRVQVVVVALGSTWVRVSVDGRIKFEGRITPGTPYLYDGNAQIEVLTGNGAAVSILHNQNDLGPMGTFGEVVDRIYTVDSVLSPTATFTPTPTRTPIPSATPRTSPTPRLSPTPTVP